MSYGTGSLTVAQCVCSVRIVDRYRPELLRLRRAVAAVGRSVAAMRPEELAKAAAAAEGAGGKGAGGGGGSSSRRSAAQAAAAVSARRRARKAAEDQKRSAAAVEAARRRPWTCPRPSDHSSIRRTRRC